VLGSAGLGVQAYLSVVRIYTVEAMVCAEMEKVIKQGELPWEWLSEEEQQAKIEASKRAHGYYEDK